MDIRTYGHTDGHTDTPSYRVASPRLKSQPRGEEGYGLPARGFFFAGLRRKSGSFENGPASPNIFPETVKLLHAVKLLVILRHKQAKLLRKTSSPHPAVLQTRGAGKEGRSQALLFHFYLFC